MDLSEEEKDLFNTKNTSKKRFGPGKAREFIDNYINCYSQDKNHTNIILKSEIKEIFK
jgi:hypothetical protein